jgi:hypothetical protein
MASITHGWKKPRLDGRTVWAWCRAWLLAWVLTSLAHSAVAGVSVDSYRVIRTDESIEAHARLDVQLSEAVASALSKGVPLYFVWQADVIQERWYWRDKRVATHYRTWRLAYQPLTRRWRLSLSTQALGGGQQFLLHQNVAQLDAALATIGRLNGWALMPSTQVDARDDHLVELSFRLDASLLPRPFQIGLGGSQDWSLRWQVRQPVPSKVTPSVRAYEATEPDTGAVER